MSLLQIILSDRFIVAVIVYGLATLLLFPLSVRISNRLDYPMLFWIWDRIAIPLLQVLLLILFICLSYPLIFGMQQAPSIGTLLHGGELRMNNLVKKALIDPSIEECIDAAPKPVGSLGFSV